MSFSDHKITAFTHRIADLPDQPNLPADELKARFDSSPEELRTAHNAVCDDADRLEARVEGIVVETFGDTIDKEMLSTELAAELDAKATKTALAAEQTARESADATLQSTLAQKCELYCGSYSGNGLEDRYFTLGFQPRAVLVVSAYTREFNTSYAGLSWIAVEGQNSGGVAITSSGFRVHYVETDYDTNYPDCPYMYLAFR